MNTPVDPPPRARIPVLIAGDQPLIRRGMALLLAAEADIEVVGEAADGPGSLLPLVFAPVCSRSSAGA